MFAYLSFSNLTAATTAHRRIGSEARVQYKPYESVTSDHIKLTTYSPSGLVAVNLSI